MCFNSFKQDICEGRLLFSLQVFWIHYLPYAPNLPGKGEDGVLQNKLNIDGISNLNWKRVKRKFKISNLLRPYNDIIIVSNY